VVRTEEVQYTDAAMVVIRDWDSEHEHVWLAVGTQDVFIRYANGEGFTLIQAPHYCKPQREPRTVRWKTQTMGLDRNGLHAVGEPEYKDDVIHADPPELCDAYDAWLEQYVELRKLVEATWAARCVTA
jgi:hypothetical protein